MELKQIHPECVIGIQEARTGGFVVSILEAETWIVYEVVQDLEELYEVLVHLATAAYHEQKPVEQPGPPKAVVAEQPKVDIEEPEPGSTSLATEPLQVKTQSRLTPPGILQPPPRSGQPKPMRTLKM